MKKGGVIVPLPSIMQAFDEFAESLLDQADTLRLQIKKFAVARDLLLPNLMNGEIAV